MDGAQGRRACKKLLKAPEEVSLRKEVVAQTLERTGLDSGPEVQGKDVARMTKITGLILGGTSCF